MFWKTDTKQIKQIEQIDEMIENDILMLYSDGSFYHITSYEAGVNKYRLYGDKLSWAAMEIMGDRYIDLSVSDMDIVIDKILIRRIISRLFDSCVIYSQANNRRKQLVEQILKDTTETEYSSEITRTQGDFFIEFGYIFYMVKSYKQGANDVVKICTGDKYAITSSCPSKKINNCSNLLDELLSTYKIIVDNRLVLNYEFNELISAEDKYNKSHPIKN